MSDLIPANSTLDLSSLAPLLDELSALHHWVCEEAVKRIELQSYTAIDLASPSLRNLAHYLALREKDVRPLQQTLAHCALTSLGRSEAHVMHTLETLIRLLGHTLGRSVPFLSKAPLSFDEGEELLKRHTERMFGVSRGLPAHIMVTLPTEAATESTLIDRLVQEGVSCFRINCAHDSSEVWEAMIARIQSAESRYNHHCTILMDLGGPKLRTGALSRVVKHLQIKHREYPGDDEAGLLLTGECTRLHEHNGDGLLVDTTVLTHINIGDHLHCMDARGKARRIDIIQKTPAGDLIGYCKHKAVISLDTPFELHKRTGSVTGQPSAFRPARLHAAHSAVRVFRGEEIRLCRSVQDRLPHPTARVDIEIQVPEVLNRLPIDTRIWFDDGKLGGTITAVESDAVLITLDHAPPKGGKLARDKGINIPGVNLGLSSLSKKDLYDLDFVASHADLVGLSYVEHLQDVELLIEQLKSRDAMLPIILKIETGRGLAQLPGILMNMLDRHPLGVMIARGDLAVEVGGERMAELQEELLWLCEAAHIPVVWATQVMESLIKEGKLSRPEMTDAAASARADCVMLNKGPYIVEGVRVLADILGRMQAHQHKKTPQLRPLHWSESATV
ncbi:MAG: pyruvate kinase [Gammaproteobacteria bacterium]|nr:pyruvate kinase [Gammaproteobacteria bacterium]